MGNWKLRLEIQRVCAIVENMGCGLRQWNSPIRSLFESFSPEGQILFLNVYARDFQMGDRFVHTTIKACLAVMPH